MAHNYNTGYAVVTGDPNLESTLQGGTIKYVISSDGTQRWVFKDGNAVGSKWELVADTKTPNYLVVDTAYTGVSEIGVLDKPFSSIKDACSAVQSYDPTSEAEFVFLLKTGTHTFDTLSGGSPMPRNIEVYTESNTTLIIDGLCILNNSKFIFGTGGQLLFTNYGFLSYRENGSHYINCDTIGIHKINSRGGTIYRDIINTSNFIGDIDINADLVVLEIDTVDPVIDKRQFLNIGSGTKIKSCKIKVNTYDASGITVSTNSYMVRNINNEFGDIDIAVNTVTCPDRSGRLVSTSHCSNQSGKLNVSVGEVTCGGLSFITLETNGNINNANLHLANAKINGAVFLVLNYDFSNLITADDFFGVTITGSAIVNPYSGVNSFFESLFAQNTLFTAATGVRRGYIHFKDVKLDFIDTPTYGGFLFTVHSYRNVANSSKGRIKYILEDCEIKTNNKELFRVFDTVDGASNEAMPESAVELYGTNKFDVGTANNLYRYDTVFYWDKTDNLLVNYGRIYHNATNENYADARAIVHKEDAYTHKLFDTKPIEVVDASLNPSFDKNIVYDNVAKEFGFVDRVDGVEFADTSGVVQYSSTIDKRSGYYDTTNNTFYSDISTLPNNSVVLTPKDGVFALNAQFNGDARYLLQLPTTVPDYIDFDVDIWHCVDTNCNEKRSSKFKVSVNDRGLNKADVLLLKTFDNSYTWQVTYGFHQGRKCLVFDLNGSPVVNNTAIIISNVRTSQMLGGITPLNIYEGWDFSFHNANPIDTTTEVFNESDMLPLAKPNGVQSAVAGANVTIDNTDPLNPIISSSGGSTNLSYIPSATQGTVESDTGTNAIIPSADATNAGLMKANFYEQGFITPVLVDSGGGATYTYSTGSGSFTRIGNIVHYIYTFIGINTAGTPTGQLRVNGKPFLTTGAQSSNILNFSNSDISANDLDRIDARTDGSGYFYFRNYEAFTTISAPTFTNGRLTVGGFFTTNVYIP